MKPEAFYKFVFAPCAALPPTDIIRLHTKESDVLLMAIFGQEMGWMYREQIDGPGRGYGSFEEPTITLLMENGATKTMAAAVCATWDIPFTADAIYQAIAWHDPLNYAFSRLMLWADPHQLPAVGDEGGAWETYLRVWRPGKPRPNTWGAVYHEAVSLAS